MRLFVFLAKIGMQKSKKKVSLTCSAVTLTYNESSYTLCWSLTWYLIMDESTDIEEEVSCRFRCCRNTTPFISRTNYSSRAKRVAERFGDFFPGRIRVTGPCSSKVSYTISNPNTLKFGASRATRVASRSRNDVFSMGGFGAKTSNFS